MSASDIWLEEAQGWARCRTRATTASLYVVGVDVAPPLVRLAREADPAGEYVHADAASLPFESESFDLAVAFNNLMGVDDMCLRQSARRS